MARPVDVHPEAVLEAQAAYRWYLDRNDAAAQAFLAELDRAVELISENPMRCPIHLHGTRQFLLRRFPFGVVYRESGETLQIVAVAHGRRKPGYWKDR
jgi:toxin ParE1/3/4